VTKEDVLKIMGENLKKYRDERSLTQEELAELAGISTSHCANIERGEKGVSLLSLRNLADSLCVSTDCLLYDECSEVRVHNIEKLLRNQPDSVVLFLEKMIRLYIEELERENGAREAEK